MKIYKLILVTVFLVVTSSSLKAQWTKGRGNGYYKLSAWSLIFDKHYNDIGVVDPNATRGNFNLSAYGEYGLSDKIDVIAYIPFFTRAYQNNQISTTRGHTLEEGIGLNSFGDSDIGIRYGFYKNDKIAISASLLLGIPLGNTSGGNENVVLQTGDGEFNQLLRVSFGFPFNLGGIPAYGKTYGGYNHRTEGYSDEIRFGGEVGLKLFDKLWFISRLNVLKSTKNGTLSAQNNGSIFANNIEFTNLDLEVAYYITKKIGVSYSYGTALAGRIIASAPSHSAGVFFDVK